MVSFGKASRPDVASPKSVYDFLLAPCSLVADMCSIIRFKRLAVVSKWINDCKAMLATLDRYFGGDCTTFPRLGVMAGRRDQNFVPISQRRDKIQSDLTLRSPISAWSWHSQLLTPYHPKALTYSSWVYESLASMA